MKNYIISSAIIKSDSNEVLLVRIDKELKGGVLVTPGGKLESNESPLTTAKRETKEELGIEIEVNNLIGIMN